MTLRIFEGSNEDEPVVALHGWLGAAEVEELARVVAGREQSLRIDLTQLVGADAPGLCALRRLRKSGARFTGASPYVELLLERSTTDDREH